VLAFLVGPRCRKGIVGLCPNAFREELEPRCILDISNLPTAAPMFFNRGCSAVLESHR